MTWNIICLAWESKLNLHLSQASWEGVQHLRYMIQVSWRLSLQCLVIGWTILLFWVGMKVLMVNHAASAEYSRPMPKRYSFFTQVSLGSGLKPTYTGGGGAWARVILSPLCHLGLQVELAACHVRCEFTGHPTRTCCFHWCDGDELLPKVNTSGCLKITCDICYKNLYCSTVAVIVLVGVVLSQGLVACTLTNILLWEIPM